MPPKTGKGVIRSTLFCRARWSVLLLRPVWVAIWSFSMFQCPAKGNERDMGKLRVKALELQGEVAGSPVELRARSECTRDELALLESRPFPSLNPKACRISSRWFQGPRPEAQAKRQVFSLVPS
ncbi:unnamed protein product [Symbiodinium sp. CCMP2592]|nr:unnamed protein product [Symbiodinium sp. CCMP2592]